jgi:hypothetical protein
MLMLMDHLDDPRRRVLMGDVFPIGLGRIQVERHQHHNPFHHQRSSKAETVRVITIRRRSQYLVAFLMVVFQFARVDAGNLLPVGIILYAFGISFAFEQLTTTTAPTTPVGLLRWWERNKEEKEREMIRRRELEFQNAYQAAMFEYQVLKGRRNVQIVSIIQDGTTVLYAI